MTNHQADLHRAMTQSLNWREPGQTLVPIIPPSRQSWWRRIWRRLAITRAPISSRN